MVQRHRRRPLGGTLLAVALLGALGCGASERDVAVSLPDDYKLGGQTGSLIPGCGVAPLSAEGRSVPAGDAVAVLYAADCPEQAEQLALAGAGLNDVRLQLVPLEREGVFLVRADQSLPGGDYQLAVGMRAASELRVTESTPPVPDRFGALELAATDEACPEQLQFELSLDDAALAYVSLARFDVRIDGGPEQLWVDYGALPIESRGNGSWGLLELPRCSGSACLDGGLHRLELRVRIAGEGLAPEPLQLEFNVPCPTPAPQEENGYRCSTAALGRTTPGNLLGISLCLAGAALRRRVRQRRLTGK